MRFRRRRGRVVSQTDSLQAYRERRQTLIQVIMQGAVSAVGAVAAPKQTVLKQSRSLHTFQDLPDRDLGRRARQRITIAGTGRGDEDSMVHESLEDFGKERSGDGLSGSDVGERNRLTERMGGENRQPPKGVFAPLCKLHPGQPRSKLSKEWEGVCELAVRRL